jgi:hypothetical protein
MSRDRRVNDQYMDRDELAALLGAGEKVRAMIRSALVAARIRALARCPGQPPGSALSGSGAVWLGRPPVSMGTGVAVVAVHELFPVFRAMTNVPSVLVV